MDFPFELMRNRTSHRGTKLPFAASRLVRDGEVPFIRWSHMKLLRWLLVLPVGGAGLYLGIISAILLVELLQRLCPLEDQVSGLCFANWYAHAESTAIAFGTALGAVCAVSLPAIVAPSHKRHVSVLLYLAGAAVAACFLASAGRSFLLPFGVAMSTGALAVIACFSRTKSATGPSQLKH